MDALGRDNPQASILELGNDLAGQVAAGRVGLDDRQGAFGGHDTLRMTELGAAAPCQN